MTLKVEIDVRVANLGELTRWLQQQLDDGVPAETPVKYELFGFSFLYTPPTPLQLTQQSLRDAAGRFARRSAA